MASIHKELIVTASADEVWSAVRDVGAVHTRLCPGFVTDCQMQGNIRVVTFGNGMVVREPIVDVDDHRRRLAYTATGGRTSHYAAVVKVSDAQDGGARLEWTIDLLPDAVAPLVSAMADQGVAAMKRKLGGAA